MKKTIIVFVILGLLCTLAAFANETIRFDAYQSKARLFFNNKEIKLDSPIVTINGSTYVPLREMAEKENIMVVWCSEEPRINLTKASSKNDVRDVFNNLFGFEIPNNSEIIDYEYTISSGEHYFSAKICFEEKDLQHIQYQLSKWTPNHDKALEAKLNYQSQENSWWDLNDITEAKYAYHTYTQGFKVKTISLCAYITDCIDGKYYLYISR